MVVREYFLDGCCLVLQLFQRKFKASCIRFIVDKEKDLIECMDHHIQGRRIHLNYCKIGDFLCG